MEKIGAKKSSFRVWMIRYAILGAAVSIICGLTIMYIAVDHRGCEPGRMFGSLENCNMTLLYLLGIGFFWSVYALALLMAPALLVAGIVWLYRRFSGGREA